MRSCKGKGGEQPLLEPFNICEQCDNFAAAPEFATALDDQLADVRGLRNDAAARDWDSEVAP